MEDRNGVVSDAGGLWKPLWKPEETREWTVPWGPSFLSKRDTRLVPPSRHLHLLLLPYLGRDEWGGTC